MKSEIIQSDSYSNEGYRTAFKATVLFGGVQIITIIVSILKSKIVAMWLGTMGFGIMSLFNAAISLISSISNLGLQSSAVREIAYAQGQNNMLKVSEIIKSINRWVLATGLLGALFTIILSPWLSNWLFESSKFTISFVLLSCVVLLSGIYNGHYAVLQGTRKLKQMALANVYGALAGLLCSIPIFYFFREEGIVWALILTAFSTTVVSLFYVRKNKLFQVNQSYKESYYLGLSAVKLGVMMAISNITVYLVQFIVKAFITHQGGIDDVGLYQAGWILNAQYLGLVFTAMGKDFFPRLSQYAKDNIHIKKSVNEQAEIALLILGPMIIFMLVFLPLVITILYSKDFMLIVPMTKWLLIGSLVKSGSWAIAFVFLAKGDGKFFLFNELGIKFVTLPSYLLGYYWLGLVGIGYAFTFTYIVYFIWVSIVAYRKYRISYNKMFWRMFFILIIVVFGYGVANIYLNEVLDYVIGIPILLLTTLYSFYELDKRLDIVSRLKKMFYNGRKYKNI